MCPNMSFAFLAKLSQIIGSKNNIKYESVSVFKWLTVHYIHVHVYLYLVYFSVIYYLTNTALLRQWYATCDMSSTSAFNASLALVTTTNNGLDAACKKGQKKDIFLLLHYNVFYCMYVKETKNSVQVQKWFWDQKWSKIGPEMIHLNYSAKIGMAWTQVKSVHFV